MSSHNLPQNSISNNGMLAERFLGEVVTNESAFPRHYLASLRQDVNRTFQDLGFSQTTAQLQNPIIHSSNLQSLLPLPEPCSRKSLLDGSKVCEPPSVKEGAPSFRENRLNYAGKIVALDGDRVIAFGVNARKVYLEARSKGVDIPAIIRVTVEPEVPLGGW